MTNQEPAIGVLALPLPEQPFQTSNRRLRVIKPFEHECDLREAEPGAAQHADRVGSGNPTRR